MVYKYDEKSKMPRFWQRLSVSEKLVAGVIAAAGLSGMVLIADGLYMKAKASLSQVLLNRSFDDQVAGSPGSKPWAWADFSTEGRLSAPRLGETSIMLSGASGETLAFGPAHVNGTPQPGQEGTAVIAAHRDTHFRWLKDVEPGDILKIERPDGSVLTFRASGSRIARWDQSGIDPQAFGRNLVLATCWPFDSTTSGPLRYIVEASLIAETDTSKPHEEASVPSETTPVNLY